MFLPLIFVFLFETKTELPKSTKKVDLLVNFMSTKSNKSPKRLRFLAVLFTKNAKRFKLNSGLLACVALKESSYSYRPRKIQRCKTVIDGDKAVQICAVINAPEVGIMQVLPQDSSTKRGWKICTGKKRLWSKRSQLRKPKVNICVGSYELSKWKAWAVSKKSWWRPIIGWHKRFYKRNPSLKKHHWVASYNWGPRRIPRFAFKRNYPIKVLRCFRDYKKYRNKYAKKTNGNHRS